MFQGKKTLAPISLLLAFLSFLYGLGVRLRLISYRRKKKRSLPGFVVSIGNLTVGGTGKTPAACMLAEWALDEEYSVAVLSRGYGGHYKKKALEVSDGLSIYAGPTEAGDEPYLLARKLPGVPVIISKQRYLAGALAHKKFGINFFILDDGFQHLDLERDLDLVLIDGSDPFGNGHLLPWGALREPVDQLERADAFIITRSHHGVTENDLTGFLKRRFPDKPLFLSDHVPERIIFPNKNRAYDPEFLRGKPIIAFAGIAQPEVFIETLKGLGVDLVFFKAFEDHHVFKHNEIHDLINKKERLRANYLLTTEKDWVRMENFAPECPDLAYLTVKFIVFSEENEFFNMVKERSGKSGHFQCGNKNR